MRTGAGMNGEGGREGEGGEERLSNTPDGREGEEKGRRRRQGGSESGELGKKNVLNGRAEEW